jgi:serine/threonine-protein kinase
VEASQLLLAMLGQSRDLESLLHEAFAHAPHVTWKREGPKFRAEITLSSARHQVVYIEPSEHGIADRLLLIYSLCCPAADHYHAEALRMNSTIPHGAIALREVNGRDYFVTLNNYPLGTADAEEIRRSVLELAACADAIELKLTGEDQH